MAIPVEKVSSAEGKTNKAAIAFGLITLAYQIMVCLFYAFWFAYFPTTGAFDESEIILVSFLTILVLIGFGLTNSYITNASFSGMGMTLLIFGLTLEHYFLIKVFWERAGTNVLSNLTGWDGPNVINKISFVNVGQDRFVTETYSRHSFVDAIACALCNIIAFSSLVGRIKILECFFLSLLGTFIYEINNQLLWRYTVSDAGYGMRIFIFGGLMGYLASRILGKEETTYKSPRYLSLYSSRALSLVGMCITFCFFPCLVAGSLYKASDNKMLVMESSVLRMYLALISGVLGSFCASNLTYRKSFIYDIIFGSLSGGIVYSSSSDLHPNPAVPLTCGFVAGFLCTLFNSRWLRKTNADGVAVSLANVNRYIIPGFTSGILSSILYAINQGSQGNYVLGLGTNRDRFQQGGFQLVGVSLSSFIGIFAGILLGLLFKLINKDTTASQQFKDPEIFSTDFPPTKQVVHWREE